MRYDMKDHGVPSTQTLRWIFILSKDVSLQMNTYSISSKMHLPASQQYVRLKRTAIFQYLVLLAEKPETYKICRYIHIYRNIYRSIYIYAVIYMYTHADKQAYIYAYIHISLWTIYWYVCIQVYAFSKHIYICIVVYATTRIEQIRQVAKQKGYNDPYIHV